MECLICFLCGLEVGLYIHYKLFSIKIKHNIISTEYSEPNPHWCTNNTTCQFKICLHCPKDCENDSRT